MSTTHKPTLSVRPVNRTRAHEKRKRNRVSFNRQMTALLLTPLQLIEVTTTDLSTGGLGFTSPVSLRMGDLVVIAFPRDGMSNLYLCRVRNVRWMKSLCYRVGVEFTGSQRLYAGEESIPIAWLGLSVQNEGFTPSSDGPLQKSIVV
jgi:hypothetical protein